MYHKKNIYLLIIIILISFSGCVSQNKIIKSSEICGIIVDENNKPISNFMMVCHKNNLGKKISYTNESGIFVFMDMDLGEYEISGAKNNFSKIENETINFTGSNSMFCFQVCSLNSLIEKTDRLIDNKEYEKALECLNKLEVAENQFNEVLKLCYQKFLYKKMEKLDAYEDCIRLLKKIKNNKYKKIIEKEL